MISLLVVIFAPYLIGIFTTDDHIISIGTTYLRLEGAFYALIGFLFLFYGYFRAMAAPGVSVILTIVSLGTRVILAYGLSMTRLGYYGIWMSIPIGWALADLLGLFLKIKRKKDYI